MPNCDTVNDVPASFLQFSLSFQSYALHLKTLYTVTLYWISDDNWFYIKKSCRDIGWKACTYNRACKRYYQLFKINTYLANNLTRCLHSGRSGHIWTAETHCLFTPGSIMCLHGVQLIACVQILLLRTSLQLEGLTHSYLKDIQLALD